MTDTKNKEKKAKITIDEHFCKGCGLCIEACPQHLIKIADHVSAGGYYPAESPDPDNKCTGCSLCAKVCPDVAIEISVRKKDARGGKE